jgi:hypothetical protein
MHLGRLGHKGGWKKVTMLRMGKRRWYNHVTMKVGGGVYPMTWYGIPTSSPPEGMREGNGEYLVMTKEW